MLWRATLCTGLALAWLGVGFAQETDVSVDEFVGTWVLASSDAESRRDGAVERAIADMGLVARTIARRRLGDGMPVPREIEVDHGDQGTRIRVGVYDTTFALSAAPSRYREPVGGDDMRGTHRLRGSALVQQFVGESATVTHTLRRSGDELRARVAVASPHLPADAVYELRFRRR